MIGIGYSLLMIFFGLMMVRWLLPRHRVLNRVWLGASLGLLLEMWLPALWAFLVRFSAAAHGAAVATGALLCGLAYLVRDRRPVKGWDEEETRQFKQILWVCIPLIVLSGYLQYTHVMREDVHGAWNVGQSTYGDLPMHLAFITNGENASFPMDYPFFPGQQLSYPFLADTLSTTLYMMGLPLQLAVTIPGTWMMGLCFFGVMLLAREMTLGKKTIVLATLLFFLNGGLGFLYNFDQAAGVEADGTLTVWRRVQQILYGYYQTPTNQPEPNNLRWSNLIADLLIPQRTLLGGYCMLLPCLYLLYTSFDPAKREEKDCINGVGLLGVWGGALPLIHTHSFLALGLCSAGMLVYDMIHDKERLMLLKRYLLYGLIAVVLALPQLLGFTFAQAFQQEGATHQAFLSFQFNWVNNPGGGGMRDFYFWFYVKNIGLPFLVLLAAVMEKDKGKRRLFTGAFAIILAAELIRFQPNEYDNNKLLYVAWLLCCMIVADYAAKVWRLVKGLRARYVLAVGCAVVTFLSAGLTLWRECISDYQAFDRAEVQVASWVKEKTEQEAVFLTGTQHLNPVCSIAGRRVVCGPDLWLYWHGVDTWERKQELKAFYEDPLHHVDVVQKYDVSYVYVSAYEQNDYAVDTEALDQMYERVYEDDVIRIWRVPEG